MLSPSGVSESSITRYSFSLSGCFTLALKRIFSAGPLILNTLPQDIASSIREQRQTCSSVFHSESAKNIPPAEEDGVRLERWPVRSCEGKARRPLHGTSGR